MSMPPSSAELLGSMRTARFHLQARLALAPVRLPPVFTPCRGVVLRVFRGAEELRPGAQVELKLPVLARTRALTPPVDGLSWIQEDLILTHPVVELLLDGTPTELSLLGGGHLCIPLVAPTDHPVMPTPTEQEVREAYAREDGTMVTLFFHDAQAEAVARMLAAHGATLQSAGPERQVWTLEVGSGEPVRMSLCPDFLEEIQDPEVAMSAVLEELSATLEELGGMPSVSLDVHWWPDTEAVARRLIGDLLASHPGVVHDW